MANLVGGRNIIAGLEIGRIQIGIQVDVPEQQESHGAAAEAIRLVLARLVQPVPIAPWLSAPHPPTLDA